jgi:phage replication-related protein YjqB (UPF0714/DUF867 family)
MPRRNASVRKALLQQTDLKDHAEHCSVDPESLVAIGREVRQQVRIARAGDERGIYTVFESIPDAAGVVRMGPNGLLRLGKEGAFAGAIDSEVPNRTLNDGDAETGNEFVERLVDDDPTQARLIVLAPHGGKIEPHTDEQALSVATALSATCWLCKGWHHRGAKRHWHITSAEINEASFPLLDTVMARGFTYAVAFHGMDEEEILIGGAAPEALKHEVKGAILVATSGSGIKVRVADPSDVFGGDDPHNIVNRIAAGGANGVQIEQSAPARDDFGAAIAAAVVDVFRPRL